MAKVTVAQHAGVRLVETASGDIYSVRDGVPGLILHNELGPAFVTVAGGYSYFRDGLKHRDLSLGPAVVRTQKGALDEFWFNGAEFVKDGRGGFRLWGSYQPPPPSWKR